MLPGVLLVVKLMLFPQPEFLIAFFGTTLARATAAPLNPAYRLVRCRSAACSSRSVWVSLKVLKETGKVFDPPRVVQEELQYFFKDAGTKLVLMSGNTNAEQAAQSLSIPALNVRFKTHFGLSGPSGILSTRQTALRAM